jgi:hypothetical protein
VSTYEEWRVTGTFHTDVGDEDEPYEFTWSRGYDDPEGAARNFIELSCNPLWGWTDGPHLHKRTVTVTDWTEVDA